MTTPVFASDHHRRYLIKNLSIYMYICIIVLIFVLILFSRSKVINIENV